MKRIILVDGNSLMFRSFYATAYTGNLMQNRKGLYTNAIFGFVNMLTKLQEMEHDYIFVAFDKGKNTFRHQEYDEYKGGRKPMPEEFRVQIPYIKKYLDILNIKHEEVDEFEADDLIASVKAMAKDDVDEVLVITGDKDLLQLVDDKTKVGLTRKGVGELEEYNISNFYSLMGINPFQVPDYKGLIGDSSDNLPGIKGIGPKTASSLLEKYKTLEEVVSNVDEIKGKTQELIKEGAKTGLQCKHLATLISNINLSFSITDLEKKNPNIEELIAFYKELDFNSFIKRLDIKKEEVRIDVKEEYLSINTAFSLEVYIDIEIFGENYFTATPLSLSILDNNLYYFIPFNELKKYPNVLAMLKNKHVKKNAFDYKKILVVLNKFGIELEGLEYDLLLASYIINPSYASDDLSLVVHNYGYDGVPLDESIYGKGAKAQIPTNAIISSYAYAKLKAIKDLKDETLSKIHEFDQDYIYNVELDLSLVLAKMELKGLYVDLDRLSKIGDDLREKHRNLEKLIYEEAGESFNINSIKQLGDILFVKLGLPSGKVNKRGYSTASDVLEKLAPFYKIAQYILDYRAVQKLLSTYVDGLYLLINDKGYIHPLYKQALTQTGRLSSIEPNIQNMPIRTELGKVIRDIFVSRFEGGKILSCDYSQIELRVLAHISSDKSMIDMFNSGADFHAQTASQIYECNINDVTKEMRRSAKAINFGIVYGMSAWGLSEQLGIPPQTASTYIAKYFIKFPQIKEYLDSTVNNAITNGYSKTMFNRVRYIPELSSSNKALLEFGKRTAMNAPIQGSAADIIKIAMVNVNKKMQNMKSILIAQVHDELVFDVHPDEVKELEELVVNEMQNAIKLDVNLIAEAEIGTSWLKE